MPPYAAVAARRRRWTCWELDRSAAQRNSAACTHIAWLLDVADASSDAELGILRGLLAQQNPHSKAMEAARRRPALGAQ